MSSGLPQETPGILTTVRRSIGRRLRACRKLSGLTQEQVREATSAAPRTQAQWESGETSPSADMLYRLCQLYRVSPDWLVGLPETCEIYGVSPAMDALADIHKLAQMVRPIDREPPS